MKRAFYQKIVHPGQKRMIALSFVLIGLVVLLPDLSARGLITGQPQDVTECGGYAKDVSFTVVAPDAVVFQWQMWTGKEWRNIADVWDKAWPGFKGDESPVFIIQFSELNPLTTFWDGKAFQCIVSTGKFDSETSTAAYINVLIAPGITSHPQSLERQVGDDAGFIVSTTGSNPKAYQWQKDLGKAGWTDIPGATSSKYIIEKITLEDAGDYRVIVANECGSVTSKPANLKVVQPFKIVEHPVNVEKCDDYVGDISFEVVAVGADLVYQWQYDKGSGFTDMSGEESSVLTITFKPDNDGYAFRCWVGDNVTHEWKYSNSAFQYTIYSPKITDHPDDATKNEGESATFSVAVTGSQPIGYLWQVNTGSGWTPIPSYAGSSYTINNVSGAQDGNQYKCIVTNECGTEESNPATLTVIQFEWPQSWFYQNSGTGKPIYDVQMVSEEEAFAAAYTVTGQEKILHTVDGGETWDTIQTGFTYAWRALHFETTELGWIAGSSRIAKTENGGVNWTQTFVSGQSFNDIFFTDANNGWAVSYTGGIYNTTNSGDDWDSQPSGIDGPLKSVYFTHPDTGWAVGDQYQAKALMLFTHDGGITWLKKDLGSLAVDFEDVFFVNNQVGYVVGSSYTLLKTVDGGDTWTEMSAPNYWNSSIHFVHPDTGWVCGSGGRVYMTNNGGTDWYLQETEAAGNLYGMHFFDSDNGIVVGLDGIINRTAFSGCFLPQVNLYEDQSLCTGDSYTLVADTFGVNYPTYAWSTGSSDGSIEVSSAGTYSVDVSNICGDVATDDIEIYLYPLPVANAGEDDTICFGESVQLLATGGNEYFWLPTQYLDDPTKQNPVATPPIGTTEFIVNVTDENECSLKDTVDIKVWPVPTSTFGAPVAVCGEATALITYTGTAPGGSFTWGFDDGNIISGAGQGPYTISWDTIGTKTVSLTVEENGCVSDETTADISVFPVPVSDFTVQESVCGDGLVFVTYSGIDSTGADYMWNFAGGEIVTGSDEGPYQVKWLTAGNKNISLKVDENNCIDSTVHGMIVYAIPTSTFDAPEFVCLPDGADITFTGSAADTANFSWDLDGGSGMPSKDPFEITWAITGAKTVSLVITEAGCVSDTTRHLLSANATPTSDFDIEDAVCGSDTVVITYLGSATDTATYNWEFEEAALVIGTGQGPYEANWNGGGNYNVSLNVLENNCYSDTAETEIVVSYPFEGEEICLVTVDSLTGQNLIVFEKTPDRGVESYYIYRETDIAGQYAPIGNIPVGDLSVFVDTEADPEEQQYLYKISAVDTCGNESGLSDYHKTLFLQYNGFNNGVNLRWDKYEIQGVEVTFDSYLIYRGTDSSALEWVNTISGSNESWTDKDPIAVAEETRLYYRIAGVKGEACDPADLLNKKAGAGPYSHSISNLEDNRLQASGVNKLREQPQFNIYPNPFSEVTQLSYRLTEVTDVKVEVYNLLGARILELVSELQSPGDYMYDLSASDIGAAEGIFYIRFTVDDKSTVKKVILAR